MVRPADSNYQYSPARKVAKAVAATTVAAGATVGTVLVLAKKGKLDAVADGNKCIEATKAFLKKYADPANEFISKKAGVINGQANEFIAKHEKLAELKTRAGEVLTNIKEFDFVMAKESAGEFFRSIPQKTGKFFGDARENLVKVFKRTAK